MAKIQIKSEKLDHQFGIVATEYEVFNDGLCNDTGKCPLAEFAIRTAHPGHIAAMARVYKYFCHVSYF